MSLALRLHMPSYVFLLAAVRRRPSSWCARARLRSLTMRFFQRPQVAPSATTVVTPIYKWTSFEADVDFNGIYPFINMCYLDCLVAPANNDNATAAALAATPASVPTSVDATPASASSIATPQRAEASAAGGVATLGPQSTSGSSDAQPPVPSSGSACGRCFQRLMPICLALASSWWICI
jgi:hypothetical protein